MSRRTLFSIIVIFFLILSCPPSPADDGDESSEQHKEHSKRHGSVKTSETAIEETVEAELLDEVPTRRSFLDAVAMVPGIAGEGEVHTRNAFSAFHCHGADDSDNVFMIDGVDSTDNATSDFGINVPYEAIAEVNVMTGGMDAEYGRATGAIINVVTRSGGNEFHGSVPVYYTNLDLKRNQEKDRGGYEEIDFYEIESGASLGGYIVRDNAWFYAAYNRFLNRRTDTNRYGERISLNDTFQEWFGKLTWQINADNKVVAQYAYNPALFDITQWRDDADPSTFVEQEQGGQLWKLQWTSIITPNLFLEVKAARQAPYLTIGPANADWSDDRFNDYRNGEGMYTYGNISSITDIHKPRDQYSAILNKHIGGWSGEHGVKFGAEYHTFEFEENSIYPNAYAINRSSTQTGQSLPDQWYRSDNLYRVDSGDILTFFVQDQWSWNDDLTFNIGLRWERQTQENAMGEEVYDLNNLIAPRAGAVWDVAGDGRSRAFVHVGRYYDAVGTCLSRFLDPDNSESWFYEGDYETGQWEEISHHVPAENPHRVDPDLEASFKDEIVAGYEFEFATDYSLGSRLIHNWQDNRIETIIGNEEAIRRGEENEYWYYLTNVKSAKRKYSGLELSLRKRLANNYQFFLAYTLSESKGSVANDGQAEGWNVYGDIAEMRHNRYGYLPWDDRHFLKLNGSYHLPWGVMLGASFGWRSGRPYNRVGDIPYDGDSPYNFFGYTNQYYLDPRGSHRLGHVWWLDLRLAKSFSIRDTELSLVVDAFNVTNNQFVTARREDDYYTWSHASNWMKAGTFVVGVKYTF